MNSLGTANEGWVGARGNFRCSECGGLFKDAVYLEQCPCCLSIDSWRRLGVLGQVWEVNVPNREAQFYSNREEALREAKKHTKWVVCRRVDLEETE